MSAVIDLTLEGEFLGGGGHDLLNFWNHAEIIKNGDISEIKIRPTATYNNPDYHIKWENCTVGYFYPYSSITNPTLKLDVIDDTKKVDILYYHGDELIGTIEVDPLHNNGITISGTKTVFSPCGELCFNDHLIFDDLNNINDVIHVNPATSL